MLQSNSLKLIKPSQYLIANLDILGIQNKMLCSDPQKRSMYLSLLHDFIEEAKEGSEATMAVKAPLDIICFSDNIVVAYNTSNAKSTEDRINKCHYLILYVLCLQTLALARGFFLRGSIKFGELYIDNEINFTCGQGLVETYIEESKEAIYPRVITKDKELLKIIDNIKLQNGYVLKDIFMKDADEKSFLDFLQMFDIANDLEVHLELTKYNYENHLQQERNMDVKIQQKHDWFINYFNNFCDRNNLSEYKIELADSLNQFTNKEVICNG